MSLMKNYISNWDTLTEEQKKRRRSAKFKGNPGLNTQLLYTLLLNFLKKIDGLK